MGRDALDRFVLEGTMRQIFRTEALWREVIPIAVFALIVLLIFIIVRVTSGEVADTARTEFAVSWTMRAIGGLISVVAAFGLFWRALNSESLELQFSFVLALLAGLLLVVVHWSLAIALGIIGVALILRDIWGGRSVSGRTTDAGYTDRPLP
jgi:hypothetical protein